MEYKKPDKISLDRAVENQIGLYTGYISTLNPSYKPSVKAVELFADRWEQIAEGAGLEALLKFQNATEHYCKKDYDQQYKIHTSLINAHISPALLQTSIEDTVGYFKILDTLVKHIRLDGQHERDMYLFMDIAKKLPLNMDKVRRFLNADKVYNGKEAIMVMWGYINGILEPTSSRDGSSEGKNNAQNLTEKADKRVEEMKRQLK